MITLYTTTKTFTYRDGTETRVTKPGFIGVFKPRPDMTTPELLGEHKAKLVTSIIYGEFEER